jgi:hypothetical protein
MSMVTLRTFVLLDGIGGVIGCDYIPPSVLCASLFEADERGSACRDASLLPLYVGADLAHAVVMLLRFGRFDCQATLV